MKLIIQPLGCIPQAEIEENLRASYRRHKSGMPYARGAGRLALVGGGPSVASHLHELRKWDGAIWAINGAANWCHENGIDAALATLHPMVEGIHPAIKRARLGEECSPQLFESLSDIHVTMIPGFDREPGTPIHRAPSTATGIAMVSLSLGFDGLTLFGCEGSYEETSHVYDTPDLPELWINIDAAGKSFRTKAEYFLQSEILAHLLRIAPHKIENRSGGLLQALTETPDYNITSMHPKLYERHS